MAFNKLAFCYLFAWSVTENGQYNDFAGSKSLQAVVPFKTIQTPVSFYPSVAKLMGEKRASLWVPADAAFRSEGSGIIRIWTKCP